MELTLTLTLMFILAALAGIGMFRIVECVQYRISLKVMNRLLKEIKEEMK